MKGYKHNTNRTPPAPLLLFPAPYPGESFYSVLCRYHVRSGNVNDWCTSNQLFGYNSSLTSTLLTPFHLEMVKHWFPSHAEATADKMLHQNTAYNLYAINAIPGELERIQDVVAGRRTTESFPRWMHPRTVNLAGYLRYCPKCAAEQTKLYGEPYWQVLPQVDEVEYCPLHRIRIRNSPVSLKSIGVHYHPASSVLTKDELLHPRNICTNEWDPLFKKEKSFFVQLACNIAWLLQNGEAYAGNEKMALIYKKISWRKGSFSCLQVTRKNVQQLLCKTAHSNELSSYLENKNIHLFTGYPGYLYSMSLCSHVLIMTALCGTPKAFYDL